MIIREFMDAFPGSDGYIKAMETDEEWSWTASEISPPPNMLMKVLLRLVFLAKNTLCFFLASASTAVMIRSLLTSGVVMLFPMLWLMSKFTGRRVNQRLIAMSWPWIGVHVEMLRQANQSISGLVNAHLLNVFML